MFAPHYAKIRIKRSEPSVEEILKAKRIMPNRVKRLAMAAVQKDLLSQEKTSGQIKRAEKKFQNMIDFDERKLALRNFILSFNKWRNFFCDREGEWRPKTTGQLTQIEKVVTLVQDEGIDADVFIACCFKAISWRKTNNVPGFSNMYANGLEWYQAHVEDVMAEIDAHEAY
jgi:hypothetical protein